MQSVLPFLLDQFSFRQGIEAAVVAYGIITDLCLFENLLQLIVAHALHDVVTIVAVFIVRNDYVTGREFGSGIKLPKDWRFPGDTFKFLIVLSNVIGNCGS